MGVIRSEIVSVPGRVADQEVVQIHIIAHGDDVVVDAAGDAHDIYKALGRLPWNTFAALRALFMEDA